MERQKLEDPDGITDGPDEKELLRRIDGALSLAAAVRIDSDNLPANKLIATLQAIQRNPALVHSNSIEPEARSVLMQHYQRGDEPVGTHWSDFEFAEVAAKIPRQVIEKAAALAIAFSSNESREGRLSDPLLAVVGAKLAEIFLQYNSEITRISRASSRSGKDVQIEDGSFFQFVELVLRPLNDLLSAHPSKPRFLIPAQVVRAYTQRRGERLEH